MNEVQNFAPGDREPLCLPDGSRLHFYLDAVAPPDHHHGPLTAGCFWLEEHRPVHRRRGERVIVRRLRRIWRMEKLPGQDYDLEEMIPLVKEVDGRFFFPGVSARALRYGEKFPRDWQPRVTAWLEAPLARAKAEFRQRIDDQVATTPLLPEPVLGAEELAPYPEEFWPYLRELDGGTIGVTAESTRTRPVMLDLYTVWERQNKPSPDLKPDPRVAAWPLWPRVPVELRPFFIWDDLFGVPTVSSAARNDYERMMIRRATNWKNAQFLAACKSSGL